MRYKFKMKNKSKKSITINFTHCIIHAKQSKILHIEMSLKQSYIPMLVTLELWEHVTVV